MSRKGLIPKERQEQEEKEKERGTTSERTIRQTDK
jgi:hypothetical protein